ncbi:IS4 family transposase, partial [Limosilactobacillus fermentum]|nr:IS4 family transposase [Limosilactobacillus fermentum]
MNSIKQSQSNDEAQFLIRTFFKQIGLGKIIHQINFKRHTPISPLM